MDRGKRIFREIAQGMYLESEPLPGIPLVEIYNQNRVLIENHMGVLRYGHCEIQIRMRFGILCVCGKSLELARMTKEQLIITGNILEVKFLGRG